MKKFINFDLDTNKLSWLKNINVSQKIVEKTFKPKDKTISKNQNIER